MISGPKAGDETTRLHFVYDGWNRLVAVKADDSGSPDTTIAIYEYDGLNHRIEKTRAGTTYHAYFNENWQQIETRLNSDTASSGQLIGDSRYIDAPVALLHDSSSVYYTNDANMNVTGLVDGSSGTVTERYGYDNYGSPTFYDSGWNITSGSPSGNRILFGGYSYDIESGTYLARNRYLHSSTGGWLQRDFAGYIDGMHLYAFVADNPVNYSDPSGLEIRIEVSVRRNTLGPRDDEGEVAGAGHHP